jgi:hypothetical protein
MGAVLAGVRFCNEWRTLSQKYRTTKRIRTAADNVCDFVLVAAFSPTACNAAFNWEQFTNSLDAAILVCWSLSLLSPNLWTVYT